MKAWILFLIAVLMVGCVQQENTTKQNTEITETLQHYKNCGSTTNNPISNACFNQALSKCERARITFKATPDVNYYFFSEGEVGGSRCKLYAYGYGNDPVYGAVNKENFWVECYYSKGSIGDTSVLDLFFNKEECTGPMKDSAKSKDKNIIHGVYD